MFEDLSNKFNDFFKKLRSKGLITEEDLKLAMREIRIALLEADVNITVAKEFVKNVTEKAVGMEVTKNLQPGQMIVKIVHEELVRILSPEEQEEVLKFNTNPPSVYMLSGLQGAGKTTTSAKIAKFIQDKYHKKVLLVSLDVYRPAAIKQLEILAKANNLNYLESDPKEKPMNLALKALKYAQNNLFDVLILDTAGRTHIDQPMIEELKEIESKLKPVENLLVVDSMTGQDAANIAKHFAENLKLTGVILTRTDGTSKGGAALSMRIVSGCLIKFSAGGEKVTDLEIFHPERAASRMLDMGDIMSLVEKASELVSKEEAEDLVVKIKKGKFDLDDLKKQLQSMKKMGGIGGLLKLIPGMGKVKEMMGGDFDDKLIKKQEVIIDSMTKKERKDPKIIDGSRKKRIAIGAGVSVQDVNILLKRFKEASKMMKRMAGMDQKTLMRSGLKGMLG